MSREGEFAVGSGAMMFLPGAAEAAVRKPVGADDAVADLPMEVPAVVGDGAADLPMEMPAATGSAGVDAPMEVVEAEALLLLLMRQAHADAG